MNENFDFENVYDADRKMLNLTQRDLKTMPAGIIETYGSCAQHIDLSHNRLTDLSWMPEFTVLREVILDNNRLCETQLKRLTQPFENVTILMLNKNEFADLHETIGLIGCLFPNLKHLSLHGNAICPDGLGLRPFSDYISYDREFYRSFIIRALPNLMFLDHASTKVAVFPTMSSSKSSSSIFIKSKSFWLKVNEYLRSIYSQMFKAHARQCQNGASLERRSSGITLNEEL